MSTPTSEEERFSSRLGTVLRGISGPHSTAGSIELERAPTIKIAGSDETFTVRPAPELPDEEGGRESRRLARQVEMMGDLIGRGAGCRDLKPGEFEANIPPRVLEEIAGDIKNGLQLTGDVVLEPCALHVDNERGEVKPSVEAIERHDREMGMDFIGTLYLCLPSLFYCGQFGVKRPNSKYFEPFFSQYADVKTNTTRPWWGNDNFKHEEFNGRVLLWCAYLAGTEYFIQENEKGVRITLKYAVRCKDGSDASAQLPGVVSAVEQGIILGEEMEKAINGSNFLSSGGRIGYPCHHQYATKEAFDRNSSIQALSDEQVSVLEGRDLAFAKSARDNGCKVYLVPYLSMNRDAQGDMVDMRLSKMPDMRYFDDGELFSKGDLFSYFEVDLGGHHDMSLEALPSKHADVWAMSYEYAKERDEFRERVGSIQFSYDGDYDMADGTSIYISSVLFAEVPPYADRETRNKKKRP